MYHLFNSNLQQDAHESLCSIHETLQRATRISLTNDINVANFNEHALGLINNYIICMKCKCITTFCSTMHKIIINIRGIIHLAIKDSIETKVSNICAKCMQDKSQTFSNRPKILMIIINRFDNNNRKLENVMCITESINIDRYQANLKAFIQHCGNTHNVHYTAVIKKGNTCYICNDKHIKKTKSKPRNQRCLHSILYILITM